MGLGTSLFRLFHGSTMRRFAGIPGPAPIFPFGTTLDFMRPFPPLPWMACTVMPESTAG